jgi:hypothetical protein
MIKRDKKGELLVGNIIFIILNLMFLTILMLFISQQGNGLIVLEQSYAKEVALVIDSAKPGMSVFLDFEEGFNQIKDSFGKDYTINDESIKKFIRIDGNMITVKLDDNDRRKGYSYSFFNNISFNIFVDNKAEGRQGIGFNFK